MEDVRGTWLSQRDGKWGRCVREWNGAIERLWLRDGLRRGALDTGMFHYSLLPADDQAERAKLYRAYHEATLCNPRYVGAHWFQWWDQVLTARCDGENFQCGFLSIADTPCRELVDAARDIGRRMYGLRYGKVKPK